MKEKQALLEFLKDELKGISLVGSTASFLGNSNLVVSVFDEAGQPIDGAKIIVMDRETDTSINERTIDGSEAIFSIAKSSSIRIIVEKDGFLRYDSMDYDEGRTDAVIQLFDINSNFVREEITGFGGTVEFTGLEPKEYFVTGYKQGFLPMREKINVAEIENASLFIESADNSNSSYMGISVFDSFKSMANNADISFKERIEGKELPLGIPSIKTDISGYASIIAKTGTLVIAKAVKEMEEGLGERLIEANKDNQLIIELSKPLGIVKLEVLDAQGNKASGHVVIESVAGVLLFDGNLLDGSVFFDTEGNSEAIVKIETDSGETYSQRINVQGLETVIIDLGEVSTGISPTIEFVGIFNNENLPVEGIAKGEEYWLAFQSTWPTGIEKGGVHVRVGADGVAFVESQEEGVTGFEATTSNYFYGKSYQPLPSPGNETADLQNVGMPGQENKFVELYFEEPENTVAFRIKITSSYLITKENIELHYRAWSEAGGKIFRTPFDAELGEKMFTDTKTGLYADTINEPIQVFAAKPECENDLCGAYFFVLPNGLYIDRQDFKAVTEELYALEIDLSSSKPVSITLKLDTDKAEPKLQFTGYDVDEFVDQQEGELMSPETDISGQGYLEIGEGMLELQESTNPLGFKQGIESTSLTISSLGVSPERPRKVRIYFKAVEEGAAEIKMQAIGEGVLDESFIFEIKRNKPLIVSITPGSPQIGEAFTVKVFDGEDGNPVQEAVVQVKNSNEEIVASIVGKGSTMRGLRGEYYFRNSLDPGFYRVNVSAEGYKGEEAELVIARNGILEIRSPLNINIAKESGESSVSLAIRNTGEAEIQELEYEIDKGEDFPEEFSISVTLPATIGKGQDSTATIRVLVNLDEDSEDSFYGEANLVIKGMVAGNYPTNAEIKLQINYNKQLDEDCLYFGTEHLMIRFIGRAGSTGTGEIEVKNNCGTALDLRGSAEARQKDPNLTITVPTLRIGDGETAIIKVNASNRIERMNGIQESHDYTLKFESNQLAKTIPLTVELSNPMGNLSYPPNISLWMIRSAQNELAYAQAPMQIINNGQIPITGFRAVIRPEQYSAGITFDIRPKGTYGINLFPNQPLTPQRFVYAETKQTEALQKPGQGWVQLSGNVGGRIQPNLGGIMINANYSGIKCLNARFVDSSVFSSSEAEQGTLERAIKIKNDCGEPIKITGEITPKKISGNIFAISPGVTLNPGAEGDFKLILLKSQETKTTGTIKIEGILFNQNIPIETNELTVTLKLGEIAATPDGKHTAEISLKKCESEGSERVAFPVLSSDCSAGYCDAEQLAKFIVDKTETLVKTAEDKSRRANFNAENFGNCSQQGIDYCSFGDMGIITEPFPVFLQLDYMTKEVMDKALNESNGEIKDYDVIQGEKSIENIGGIGFDFGNINIGGNFKGCGKYYVELVGAARIHNGEIVISDNTKNFWISVNIIKPGRVTTEECLHNIENTANFLPIDKGFTITEHYMAWPGFVQAGTEYSELGKIFAQELFGDGEGRYNDNVSSGSNRLEIVKGDVEGGLLKIRISKSGDPDVPKTIYAHVPAGFFSENKVMEGEIAKAFETFQKRAFSKDDCIGEDDSGQYIVMKSYSDLDKLYGKLEIKGEKSVRINTSDFLTEGKNSSKNGIEYIAIKNLNGKILLKEQANGKKEQGPELMLANDGKGNYNAAAKFCVKGNSMFTQAADNIKDISITAKSIIGTTELDRKTTPYKIALEKCGIHPKELLEKIAEREKIMENDTEETYYAIPGWKGPPEILNLSKFKRMFALQEELSGSGPAATGEAITNLSSYDKAMQPYRQGSIAVYFTACAVPAFFIPWGSVTFDCALPAIWASLDIYETTAQAKEFIIDLTKKVLGPIAKVTIAPIINGISKLFGSEGNWDPMAEEDLSTYVGEQEAETQFESLLQNAIVFSGTKTALEGLSAASTKASLSSARTLMASGIWDKFADDFLTMKGLKDLPTEASKKIKTELVKNAKSSAEDIMFESSLNPLTGRVHYTGLKQGVRGKPLDGFVKQALDASFEKSQTEFDEILGGILNSTTPPAELKAIARNKINSIFETTKVSDDVMTRIQGESLEGLTSGTQKQMQERIANNIFRAMERNNKEVFENLVEEIGTKKELQERLLTSVKDQWIKNPSKPNIDTTLKKLLNATNLPRNTDISRILETLDSSSRAKFIAQLNGNVDEIVNNSLLDFSTRNSDDIYKAMQKTVNAKLMTEFKGKYADDMAKLVKEGISKPGALTRIGRFFRGVGLGALTGITSNALGLLAHQLYWKGLGHNPVESEVSFSTSELVQVTDEEGNVIGEKEILKDIKIVKHQTYRITITKNENGRKKIRMTALTTDEQINEMAKAMEETPEKNWNIDCTSYAKKEPGLLIGNLKPEPVDGKVEQNEALAYIKNEQIINYYSNYYTNEEKNILISEELIMAVLLEQPEKIKGCNIEEKWWTENLGQEERTRIVACATERLKEERSLGKRQTSKQLHRCQKQGRICPEYQRYPSRMGKIPRELTSACL